MPRRPYQPSVKDENGNKVDLRDLVERIFDEREKALNAAHSSQQRALETALASQQKALEQARDHIERIFGEHRVAHTEKHAADQRAIEQAREVMNARLEKLNALRSEIERDRGQFITREVFDEVVSPLKEFRSRAMGFGTLLALLSGAVGAAIARIIGG